MIVAEGEALWVEDRGARFIVLLPVFSRQCAKARTGELKFTAAR